MDQPADSLAAPEAPSSAATAPSAPLQRPADAWNAAVAGATAAPHMIAHALGAAPLPSARPADDWNKAVALGRIIPMATAAADASAAAAQAARDTAAKQQVAVQRIGAQPFQADPLTGAVTSVSDIVGRAAAKVGQVATGVALGTVQAGMDAVQLGHLVLNETIAAARDPAHPLNAAASAANADPELLASARRGLAFAAGSLAFSGAGVVAGIGTKIALGEAATATPLALGLTTAARATAAGEAFAGTFGALRPLTQADHSRTHAIMHDMVASLVPNVLIGGALGSVAAKGAVTLSALRDAGVVTRSAQDALEGVTQAVKDQAAATMAERLANAQSILPPEPVSAEELIAQQAAGAGSQSVTEIGIWRRMREAVNAAADVIGTRWKDVRDIDPALHEMGMKSANAYGTGLMHGAHTADALLDGLTDEQHYTFTKQLAINRIEGIRESALASAAQLDAAAAAGDKAASTIEYQGKTWTADDLRAEANALPRYALTPAEADAYATHPALQRVKDLWRTQVMPTLLEVRIGNGTRSFAQPAGDGLFMPLQRADEEYIASGKPVLGEAPGSAQGGAVGGVGRQFSVATTPGAQRASGMSTYKLDLRDIMQGVYAKEVAVADKNALLAGIITSPYTHEITPSNAAVLPRTVEIGGKSVKMVPVELQGNGTVLDARFEGLAAFRRAPQAPSAAAEALGAPVVAMGEGARIAAPPVADLAEAAAPAFTPDELDTALPGSVVSPHLGRYLVPEPIARMHDELYNPLNARPAQAVATGKLASWLVGLRLMGLQEAETHGMRMLSVLARQPGIAGDAGALQTIAGKFIPWFGPRINAMDQLFQMNTPEAIDAEARVIRSGMATSRGYLAEQERGPVGLARKLGYDNVADVAGAGRAFLFGDGTSDAFNLDLRARTTMVRALDRINGKPLTDAEIQSVLPQLGVYNAQQQSNAAAFMRSSGLNPFASNYTVLIGELRGLFAPVTGGGLPASMIDRMSQQAYASTVAQMLWQGALGSMVAKAAVQKALTNTYPWENEPGRENDLAIGKLSTPSGRRMAYIPFSTLAPGENRAMTISGVRALTSMGSNAVPRAMRDMANAAITYTVDGPGVSTLMTALTGNSLYMTGDGSVISVVPPQATPGRKVYENLKAAAFGTNPTFEAIFGSAPAQQGAPGYVRALDAVVPGITLGRPEGAVGGAAVRQRAFEISEVASDRVRQAYSTLGSIDARLAYYRAEAAKFPTPDEQRKALQEMVTVDQAHARSLGRSAAQARSAGP